jgi:DNA relaxase NicK
MQSEHYCRLYDKGKESGIAEYDACWRYEVTYRRNKASFLAGALSQSASPEGTMLSTIYNYFYTKGVTPLFSPSSAAPLKTPPERPAGYDKKLEWMKTIIGPLCNKLIGAGYGKELYKVLPISEIQRYADNHK